MKTLILCRSESAAKDIRRAFSEMPELHVAPWHSALTGYRFDKVIWMVGEPRSDTEREVKALVLRDRVPGLLMREGELFVI